MPSQTGSIDLKAQKEAHDAAAQVATNYITADTNGIKVHMAGESTTYQHQTASGSTFYVSGKKRSDVSGDGLKVYIGDAGSEVLVGSFGSTVQIGQSSQSHVEIDYHSLQLIDKEGNTYFHVSDLRDSDGRARFEFVGDGSQTKFSVPYTGASNAAMGSNLTVLVDDVAQQSVSYVTNSSYNLYEITLGTAPASGSTVVILYPVADGYETKVKAFTLGLRLPNSTVGGSSYAEGVLVTASGHASHAEGENTVSNGTASHAEGIGTTASSAYSHAEGSETTASGIGSHAEGYRTAAYRFYSHAEGDNATANASASHAEGEHTTASGSSSHAEGYYSAASGSASHAEGEHVTSSGWASHAEGYYSAANGQSSHAEGVYTTASNMASHAEGNYTVASAVASHAQNERTIASQRAQTAIGKYNVENTSTKRIGDVLYGTYALIIGNGTADDARSNALTVDWDGNVDIAGGITLGTPLTADQIPQLDTSKLASGTIADARLPTKGTAGTAGTSSATSGATLAVPYVTTDAYGRVTAKGTHTHTINSLDATAIGSGTLARARGGTGVSGRQSSTITRNTSNTTTTSTSYNYAYHNGVVATVGIGLLQLASSLANGGTVAIGTVPSGYRPLARVEATVSVGNANVTGALSANISTAGVITLVNRSGAAVGTTVSIGVTATYCI